MDFKAIFAQVSTLLKKLNKKQKIAILITVIVIVAFLAYLIVSSIGSGEKKGTVDGYSVLFEGMTPSDSALVLQYLQKKQIPYKLPDDKTILVPKDKVYEERISLASQGLPKDSRVGFEIFDNKDFGSTEGEQKIKFLRATEGELSRTIESLSPITRASVRIALPEDTVFVSRAALPTASVVLALRPNMVLSPKQIFGIKNLVAASVSKLTPDNVKVVDENGDPLGEDDELSTTKEKALAQLKYKQNYERDMESKIISIISPIVGGNQKVVAKVNADFDFAQRNSTQETFDPNNVIRSQQNLEEKRTGPAPKQVGGVPGAVSNIGPVQGLDDNGQEKYEKNQDTTNYEVGKTVSEIKGEYGTLTRLSAAVVVDGKYQENDTNGVIKYIYHPLSEQELNQINALVKQAIGYNQTRGDEVTVGNFEFNPLASKQVVLSGYEKTTQAIQKYLGPFMPLLRYVIVIIILFFFYKKVIAPFAERMLEVHEEEEDKTESIFDYEEDEDALNRANEMRKKVEEQLGIGEGFNEDAVKYDVLLEKIKDAMKEKPEEVASLFQALIKDEIEIK
ncbi:flagellar basal-body MS-ring/collar protein FliF [Helicobacter sp. 11S02629-2]|uniref:flagellar basal-body MS-ring/collar protein FliF n=1 Tax=Helicobacter sp. 11S02629-2 TaxID=1476195 RepID=UPI000BA7B795|nr:flagellar basal-body MS-ring/collar protein FliF [Helicobacter sp. 11S02629-2]PAF44578.1 flagellar M-ring protein FliF [Helicobacter sp. 11S02629-2]